ncbi:MAG: MFS transporter [Pseudomonadota bacterium]
MQRWAILAALTVARIAMAVQFQSIAALAPQMSLQFGLGFAAIGTLAGIYLLPGAIAALFGGWAGQRIGDIRTALGGLMLMALGGFAGALVSGFEAQLFARLVAGVGAVALNVMLTKMAGDWFQGRSDLPAAMGILVSSWPAGLALAMLIMPYLSDTVSLSILLMLPATLSLLAFAILGFVWRAPFVDPKGVASVGQGLGLTRAEWILIGTAGAIWGLYNVAFIAVITWSADKLIEGGLDAVTASAAGSLIGWAAIFSVAAGGMLARSLPRPDGTALGCFILSCAALLIFAHSGAWTGHPAVMLALGIVIGPAAAMVMTLSIEATRADVRAFGMGVYWAIYYALMGVAPALLGALRDGTDQVAAPLSLAAGIMGLCAVLWVVFRGLQRRILPRTAP